MPRFDAHGEAQMDVQGRVLSFRPRGPGNVEEVQRLLDEIDAALPALSGAAWVALLVSGTDTLLTPDAEMLLKRSARRLVASGQRAMAIVVEGEASGLIVRGQFERVYVDTGCSVEVSRSEGDARAWLETKLQG